jgi:NADPH-dependent 2,4-dienoyl-CoA reductase/sulfur reductase-like enzyme
LTSARAIKAYREAGGEGKIALISADSTIPYHRPPLSKRYLCGEAEREDTVVDPQAFYDDDNDVELLLSTTVASIEPRERAVATDEDSRAAKTRKPRSNCWSWSATTTLAATCSPWRTSQFRSEAFATSTDAGAAS